jgi:23S rRNA G2445 N2-methylase RlmL
MQAAGRAPDLERAFAQGFALDRWPAVADDDATRSARAALRDEARARASAAAAEPAAIFASDRDARAIESARRNAARAGVEDRIAFACRAAEDARAPAAAGLVVTNPPYGRRLGDARAAARGYRDLGRTLRAHFRGWRAAILVPASLDPERTLALRGAKRFALRNGGLPVTLVVAKIE